MRLVLATAAALCLGVTPAMAQSTAEKPAPDRARAVADALNDPMVQEGVAMVMGHLAGIVLDTRVGPVAHYADPRIGENDTLGDIQRRRDPDFDKHLHENTRRAAVMAGHVARDAVAMRDSLVDTSHKLDAALAPLRDALRRYGATQR